MICQVCSSDRLTDTFFVGGVIIGLNTISGRRTYTGKWVPLRQQPEPGLSPSKQKTCRLRRIAQDKL